jgi:hypothetical protein
MLSVDKAVVKPAGVTWSYEVESGVQSAVEPEVVL